MASIASFRGSIPAVEWWPIFWMFVILKIPLLAALWIVWWALRSDPAETDDIRADEGGGGPKHPRSRRPGPTRRGPHTAPAPRSPGRVRVGARRNRVHHR